MSRRTVMTARLTPPSLREGPRAVFVCLPESTITNGVNRVGAVLGRIIRPSDRLLYSGKGPALEPLIAFSERHGIFIDPLVAEPDAPDLIVVIVDPLADNTLAQYARALAVRGRSDLIIAELPDAQTQPRTTRPPATAVQTRKSAP